MPGGYVGYRYAVKHVYAIFGYSSSEIDQLALEFRGVQQQPRFSCALDGSPDIHRGVRFQAVGIWLVVTPINVYVSQLFTTRWYGLWKSKM